MICSEPAEDRRTKRTSSENQDKCSIGHRSIASNAASAGHPIKSKWSHHHRGSRSLAGSRMSLNTLPDQSLNWSVSLDQLTDSPLTGGYFKHLPSHQQWMSSSSTMSLDLAVDRLRFCTSSPLFCPLSNQRSALQHHSSAPDLRSAESPASSPITQHREEETLGTRISSFLMGLTVIIAIVSICREIASRGTAAHEENGIRCAFIAGFDGIERPCRRLHVCRRCYEQCLGPHRGVG